MASWARRTWLSDISQIASAAANIAPVDDAGARSPCLMGPSMTAFTTSGMATYAAVDTRVQAMIVMTPRAQRLQVRDKPVPVRADADPPYAWSSV